ncbi:MAG: EF-P lysine aminoacylase EpmA [Gammaproteobacteria bacterium]|nr:EF-P lysine aminoacylase EpmA [Gammaproteobacteria bacterium]
MTPASRSWQPACSLAALQARSEMLRSVREFFYDRGVIEVQTPCISDHTVTDAAIESFSVSGGAGFLQTSPEYQLKRLLAAGAPSLFQLGPVFRAGEAGRVHNPEFTMLEWYRLGYSDTELMEELAALVDQILGPGVYKTMSYAEVAELGSEGADVADSPRGDLRNDRAALDLVYANGLERLGSGRVFVVDYPADQAALARLRPDNPEFAARFELSIDGVELANGYWELDDHRELRQRFEKDLAARQLAGLALPEVDGRFLDAMQAGLPDCAGVALGIDRMLMAKLGARSLAEIMPFPVGV